MDSFTKVTIHCWGNIWELENEKTPTSTSLAVNSRIDLLNAVKEDVRDHHQTYASRIDARPALMPSKGCPCLVIRKDRVSSPQSHQNIIIRPGPHWKWIFTNHIYIYIWQQHPQFYTSTKWTRTKNPLETSILVTGCFMGVPLYGGFHKWGYP